MKETASPIIQHHSLFSSVEVDIPGICKMCNKETNVISLYLGDYYCSQQCVFNHYIIMKGDYIDKESIKPTQT